jgi:hypothetical protein
MVDIFVEKNSSGKPTFDMGVLFNRKEANGELGLEIEMEGVSLPHEDETPAPWAYKPDGSLRGLDNGEYVLLHPIEFKDLPAALDKLWGAFKKRKTKFDDSNRTSVHVHLNCQRFHLNRLTSFMALYFCFEDLLAHWCGEHRVGNLFTLRAKDAPAIITSIKKFLRSDGQNAKWHLSDNLHYSGLAIDALPRFGSLEIRLMGGTSDPKAIQDWVNMLHRLYELSSSFRDPREIIEQFSEMGPMQFLIEMMGPQTTVLRNGIAHTDQQVRESVLEGIRLAQDLCYCRDWSKDKEVSLKTDPFGRDTKKLMDKIVAMSAPVNEVGGTTFAAANSSWISEGIPVMPEPEGHWIGGMEENEMPEEDFHDEI